MAKRAVAVLRPRERTRDEWSGAIREAYAAIRGAFGDTVQRAAVLGGMLVEAKSSDIIDHGDWDEFLEEDCRIRARTARKYAQFFKKWSELSEAKRHEHAVLGLEGAMEALAGKDERTRLPKGADLEPEWNASQTARRHQAEMGQTVRLDMHDEQALQRWAEENGRFVRCDRKSVFGNPYVVGEDGDHDEVCDGFELGYWPYKRSLHRRLPELAGGKVLGCWCRQDERCHCDTLIKAVEALDDEEEDGS